MKKTGNILWGIVLIALGVIWGLNALGITNVNIFFNGWWTLFIIIPCFIGLFKNESKLGNLIGLLIGILFLLAAQDLISIQKISKLILPIILVLVGIHIIFKDSINKRFIENTINVNKDNLESYCATFSGQKVNITGENFKGLKLDAIFGGIDVDLTSADIKSDQVINASAIFGGIDIIVPKGINVKVKSNSIFGGVNNKIKDDKNNTNTIYVNASCLFGGVDIK